MHEFYVDIQEFVLPKGIFGWGALLLLLVAFLVSLRARPLKWSVAEIVALSWMMLALDLIFWRMLPGRCPHGCIPHPVVALLLAGWPSFLLGAGVVNWAFRVQRPQRWEVLLVWLAMLSLLDALLLPILVYRLLGYNITVPRHFY